jgi:DNA-3-methyladenine glycosylase
VVAPDLLGRLLVRRLPEGDLLVGRIVECEAYQADDPASHSYRGPTLRTAVMFGPPGHLYVYFSYGAHWCVNVVTGRSGEGSAVLLRAVEPLRGVDTMRRWRGVESDRLLCSGPGRLSQAFGLNRTHNGADLTTGIEVWLAAGRRVDPAAILAGRRVGISVARERPWRFVESGSRFLSRPPTPSAPSGRGRAPARRRRG